MSQTKGRLSAHTEGETGGVDSTPRARPLVLICLVASPHLGTARTARAAATCSDYSNQRQAQLRKDTRHADADGIYCESLPCPCLGPSARTRPPALALLSLGAIVSWWRRLVVR